MEEDYKKKYENLIENLKRAKETKGGHTFKSVVDEFVPELNGNEDERMWKLLKKYAHSNISDMALNADHITRDQLESWIKKQCIDISSFPEEQQTFMKNYASLDKITLIKLLAERDAEIIESVEKQCDQSDEKVEPKFKAGDWVVANNGESGVFRVEEDGWPDSVIRISGSLGNQFIATCTLNKQYHHWTIQDAKDGDILAIDNDSICVFDGTVEDGKYPFAYCGLTRHHGFEVYDRKLPFTHDNNVHPSTKEQCDLLFEKMHEAGYEWDAEKKELKKIQTKIAWSEEDESMFSGLNSIVEDWYNTMSEKEKEYYGDCGYIDWLKSLKERCYWKPSDEQMKALYTYIYNPQYFNSPDPRMELVESVYNDLKKLKGE